MEHYKIRKFDGKEYERHNYYSTMIDARNEKESLNSKGYDVKFVSLSPTSTGAILYIRKKTV